MAWRDNYLELKWSLARWKGQNVLSDGPKGQPRVCICVCICVFMLDTEEEE